MKDRRSAEELREALIDLDRAREHERQMRLQTETLLEGLRVLTQAQNTRDLFVELLTVLQRFVPFEAAFLLQEAADGMLDVMQSTSAVFEGLRWKRGSLLERVASGRIVAAFDIDDVEEWQALSDRIKDVRSALHVPLHTNERCSMLVLTHAQRAFFGKHHVEMLERFAPLTRQAMASIEYRERLEEHTARIEFLATHDALTGLPNRVLLAERVKYLIAHARRQGGMLALLFLDLDRFKHINDSFGHGLGDELLKIVAIRLQQTVRDTDTVTRLGGDEFVVLLGGLIDMNAANAAISKILKCIEQPMVIGDQTLFVTASAGAALFPDDGHDLASLLKNADAAMYRAKDEGGNMVRYYATDMSEHARRQLEYASALRLALTRSEFELYYQPRMDLATRSLVGMEALMRWRHPTRGLVPPSEFIPVAEDNGLIVPMGEWVIDAACRQARAWQDAGLPTVPVAVNVSGRQTRCPEDLLAQVQSALNWYHLPGDRLEIELTESVVMHEPERLREMLAALGRLGVRIAIDDFGTGYSSLACLKRFPFSLLKIDRSFIRDLSDNSDDAAIARAIVSMGHVLGLRVVAEGVETDAQACLLRDMGCDEAQGYLFGKPISAATMTRRLRAWQAGSAGAPLPHAPRPQVMETR